MGNNKKSHKSNYNPNNKVFGNDEYDVSANFNNLNRFRSKSISTIPTDSSSSSDICHNYSNEVDTSEQTNVFHQTGQQYITPKDLLDFSSQNNYDHNELRKELEGKIDKISDSKKWLWGIFLPLFASIIIFIIGYFVQSNIKERVAKIETTIEVGIKPNIEETKSAIKELKTDIRDIENKNKKSSK